MWRSMSGRATKNSGTATETSSSSQATWSSVYSKGFSRATRQYSRTCSLCRNPKLHCHPLRLRTSPVLSFTCPTPPETYVMSCVYICPKATRCMYPAPLYPVDPLTIIESPAFHTIAPSYSYHAIAAAVRLGHKYQMSDLLDDALKYLKAYYPTDYDEWSALTEYGPPGSGFEKLHAVGVVNLARLTNDVDLLLMALLVCCTIDDGKRITYGFTREDGSREGLTPNDIALCYTAKTRLIAASVKLTLWVFRPEISNACNTSQNCLRGFQQILKALADIADTLDQCDPSCSNAQAFRAALGKGNLCKPCEAMVAQREVHERKAVWAKLPEIFGINLPPQLPSARGSAR